MNQISPYATGGAMITVATVEPLVTWALTGFKAPMPPAVPGVISAIILTLAHAVGNLIATRMSKPTEVARQ
jgi:ABC-type molybdate transport system permease subunit